MTSRDHSERGGTSPPVEAVLFDLYGTLLVLEDPALLRELPDHLGTSRRRFVDLARRLMVTNHPDRESFVRHVCQELAPTGGDAALAACEELLQRELASVRLLPGVRSLLAFLRHRGFRLALLSNLSSAHAEPLARLELEEMFDAVVLSFLEGRAKPHREVYLEACRRLGAPPPRVLSVGNSPVTDVEAPRQLGMRAVRVAAADRATGPDLAGAAQLGWRSLAGDEPLRELLPIGDRLELGDRTVTVRRVVPLPDHRQGRYNLVAEVETEDDDGETSLVGKRYLDPASAWVEAFAFTLQGRMGLPTCVAAVVAEAEPVLVATRAAGEPFPDAVTPEIAYQVGRHTVFAYVFANADMRPRNAFVDDRGSAPRMTMIDLEHCFLDLALDASELDDPFSPHAIDRLDSERLRASAPRRVLTDRTLRRARSAYFPLKGTPAEVVESYRQGVVDEYVRFKAQADDTCEVIRSRVYTEPYLVVGTRGYRRAMAGLDITGIRQRLDDDPARVADVLCMPDEQFRTRSRT